MPENVRECAGPYRVETKETIVLGREKARADSNAWPSEELALRYQRAMR